MSTKRAALWSISANYTNFVIQFVTSVIISRFFLLPEEVGLFSVAIAASILIAVLQDFGVSRYLIAQKHNDEETIRASFSVVCFISLLIAGLLAALSTPLGTFYGNTQLTPILLVIALAYLFGAISVVPVALLSKEMDFRSVGAINVAGALANAITSISLAAHGYSAISLAWGLFAGAIARGIVGYLLKPAPLRLTFNATKIRPVLSFGALNSLLIFIGTLGYRTSDLIIGRIVSMSATGLFTRASGLTSQLHTVMLGAVSGVFYPAFAKLNSEDKPLAPHYERVVAVYGAIVWPAMLLLSAAAYPLINFLYGSNWSAAAPLLTILAISEIIFVMLPLHIDLPILLGRIRSLLVINTADTFVSVGLLIFFAQFGIIAAAVSRIAYGIIWYFLYAGFMHRIVKFSWKNLIAIYCKSAIVAVATVLPLIAYFMVFTPAAQASFLALIPAFIISAAIWLTTLILVRHPGRKELFEILESAIKIAFPRFQLPMLFHQGN